MSMIHFVLLRAAVFVKHSEGVWTSWRRSLLSRLTWSSRRWVRASSWGWSWTTCAGSKRTQRKSSAAWAKSRVRVTILLFGKSYIELSYFKYCIWNKTFLLNDTVSLQRSWNDVSNLGLQHIPLLCSSFLKQKTAFLPFRFIYTNWFKTVAFLEWQLFHYNHYTEAPCFMDWTLCTTEHRVTGNERAVQSAEMKGKRWMFFRQSVYSLELRNLARRDPNPQQPPIKC